MVFFMTCNVEVDHDSCCLVMLLQAASELFDKYRGDAPAGRKLLPQAVAMACECFASQRLVCNPESDRLSCWNIPLSISRHGSTLSDDVLCADFVRSARFPVTNQVFCSRHASACAARWPSFDSTTPRATSSSECGLSWWNLLTMPISL